MKPSDKDLRLYGRLSDVDDDLILDSMLPQAASVPPYASRRGIRGRVARPQAAAVALFTLLLALTVSALLATGVYEQASEPPPHGVYPPSSAPLTGSTESEEPPAGSEEVTVAPSESMGPAQTSPNGGAVESGTSETDTELSESPAPTYEDAALLKKGMAVEEMLTIMGNVYTQADSGYTFTLDTGESLTVTTAANGTEAATVAAFTWLGETAQAVNPLGIDPAILQRLQEYAADRVFPVYTVQSLFITYGGSGVSVTPSIRDVLEKAGVLYFRVGVDGTGIMLDGEGNPSDVQGEVVSRFSDLSTLFDESVRIKAYYPIMTVQELGAIYLRTSIGDYILYFHGNTAMGSLAPPVVHAEVPTYLLPVREFRTLAQGIIAVDDGIFSIGWVYPLSCMEAIHAYELDSEDFMKPVNTATPEAAEQVAVGMNEYELIELLGNGLTTEVEQAAGLFGWELTNGQSLVVTTKTVETYSGRGDIKRVATIHRFDSAEAPEGLGQMSAANAALIQAGMSMSAVEAIMSPHAHLIPSDTCEWTWQEGDTYYTLTVYRGYYTVTGTIPTRVDEARDVSLTTASEGSPARPDHADQVVEGMSQEQLLELMGESQSSAEEQALGIFYWRLADGKGLFVYCRSYMHGQNPQNNPVSHVVWLDSAEVLDHLGAPGYAIASRLIQKGMGREAVIVLMGKAPVGSYISSSTSAPYLSLSGWTWEEDGVSYTFNVYWEPMVSLVSQNDVTVREATLTEIHAPGSKPTPALTLQVTEGMSDVALLNVMGGTPVEIRNCADGFLYIWELSDGRFFGAVMEDLTSEEDSFIQLSVTYTFSRDSMADMTTPTLENMEKITVGMSGAAAVALLGIPNAEPPSAGSTTYTWCTMEGEWIEVTVEFAYVAHPETQSERLCVQSVTFLP